MTLADSHVKTLLKEGTGRAGAPPSGGEFRISPEAITAAKDKAEEFLRALGESSARAAMAGKRSTIKSDDVSSSPANPTGGSTAPAFS